MQPFDDECVERVRILLEGRKTVVIPVHKVSIARNALTGVVGNDAGAARIEGGLASARRRWISSGRQQPGCVGELERGQDWAPNASSEQRSYDDTEYTQDGPIGD